MSTNEISGNGDGRRPDPKEDFLVVGIGASAGGIQALSEFFSNVKKDSGIAYVVILHLSPDHESRLAEVLQVVSPIAVTQVREKVKIEPNHVFVVPPNKSLSMQDGHIVVKPIETIEERRAPVDIFFRTLADSHHDRAAGVILSGTGADGSMGLKRIKERGGVVFVQNPRESEFNEMARNAIATDLVDQILPVAEIPRHITDYRNRAGVMNIPDEAEERPEDQQNALRDIFAQLRVRTGHDFSNYKRPTMLRRIERRISVRHLPDLTGYAAYLRDNPEEPQALLKDLLISVTNFFRDKKAFEYLEKEIIPRLLRDREADDPLRIWVAGCATGEEAYSIAMIAAEKTVDMIDPPKIQIFATDIDDQAIRIARDGLYTLNDAADVSPERLRRFFVKEGSAYRIRRELRELVLFASHNALKDPPFSHVDMVSCRNLLIYLNQQAQERLFETFHFALEPGGYLFIGPSESIDGSNDLFAPMSKEFHIFQSRAATSRPFPVPESVPAYRVELGGRSAEPSTLAKAARERITYSDLHLRLLEEYAPPSVIVNQDYDVVHVSQSAGKYLQVTGGEVSNNLLRLVQPDMRLELRTALFQAMQRKTSVEAKGIRVKVGAVTETLNILVRPVLEESDTARGFVLVLFEPAGLDGGPPQAEAAYTAPEPIARQLEEELLRSRSQLQSALEQSEVQGEELRASNEELQAINEELRSSTEELETSKEELQSINEELTTVNQELKVKIDELSRTNNNFTNLLNSVDIGVIFLDRALRVNIFSPAACEIFNLIPNDVGRPLSDITNKLVYDSLHEDAEKVLGKLQTLEREVVTADGTVFMMRIFPYRTAEDKINGVVVTFVDIADRKRAEIALAESEEQFRRAIHEAPIPVIMHAEDGEVLQVSNTWTQLTGYSIEDVQTFDAWLTRAYGEGADGVRSHMHELFKGDKKSLNIEFPIRTRRGETRYWSFSSSSPGTLRDGRRFIVGTAVDITDRTKVEAELRASEEKFRSLFNSIDEGFCTIEMLYDEAGKVADWRFLQVNRAFELNNGLHDAEGKTIRELAPDIEPKWLDIYDEIVKTGKPRRFEEDSLALGRVFSLYAFRVGEPEEHKVAVIFTDITEKKHAENILAFQGHLLNTVEQSVIATDLDGRITYWNKYAERMFGWTADEVMGRPIVDINVPEPDLHRGEEIMNELRQGKTWSGEFLVKRKDGSTFPAHVFNTPISDQNGQLVGIVGVSMDITNRRQTEAALRASEERLRLLMDSFTDIALFTTDVNTIVTAWNPGAEKVFGFTAEEMVGKKSADVVFTPEDIAKGEPDKERAGAVKDGKALDERWHIRKNGERFFASGFMVPLTDGENLIGYGKIASDLTQRKQYEDELNQAREELEKRVAERTKELAETNASLRQQIMNRKQIEEERINLLRKIVTTQEDERRRIARDLHDQMGQRLTALRLQMASLKERCGDDEDLCAQIEQLQKLGERIDAEASFLAWELRPTVLDDLGLVTAVDNFVREWSAHFGIKAEFHSSGLKRKRLTSEIETNLYRITQEALNNVYKHSQATAVNVLLEFRKKEVVLIVEDNGVGFDQEQQRIDQRHGSAMGLLGINERAAIVGGTVEIESGQNKGTTVFARIPAVFAKDEKEPSE
jgi:two-component system CheB/CheR fusion protein